MMMKITYEPWPLTAGPVSDVSGDSDFSLLFHHHLFSLRLETQDRLYKPTDIADRVSGVSGFFTAPVLKTVDFTNHLNRLHLTAPS